MKEEVTFLLEQEARCRRLAKAITTPDVARELMEMATQYAERALSLLQQPPVLVQIGKHPNSANA